jgi:putative heme iron utilization protein
MKTITFNLKEFEEWLSDMESLGIYGLVEDENDVEHTDGMPIGTVYHAYYGTRYEQIKGEIKDG